jgi:hypothetical protein
MNLLTSKCCCCWDGQSEAEKRLRPSEEENEEKMDREGRMG